MLIACSHGCWHADNEHKGTFSIVANSTFGPAARRGVSDPAGRPDICVEGLMKEIGMEAPSIDFGELPAPVN